MTKMVVKKYRSIYCDRSPQFAKLIMINIYSKFFIGIIKNNTCSITLNNKNKLFFFQLYDFLSINYDSSYILINI